ncbi:unnamed protein product [Brugia pahangi]|uniref:Kinesin motor domain-containing protein n=1 Tax=Brugia pahangi TaxID=6280 RepID=A0A0N4TYV5_BRUPA|nr:unnamed protein product [Brugia pahangi]
MITNCLIVKTLDDAAKADSASAMNKILQTALKLYTCTSSRNHDSKISSVSVLAVISRILCFTRVT